MNLPKLFTGMGLYILVHTMLWFSINTQFIKNEWRDKSLFVSLGLAIPISVSVYYAARFTYEALGESAWGVRFVGFGMSYMIFPVLTWWLLKESMFTPKTLTCIMLSLMIVLIQIFWK